jgi:hypothetical protein
VRVFRQKFTLEDAIGSHACSLEANTRVTNGIPLGCLLMLPVDTVNCVQTLKAGQHEKLALKALAVLTVGTGLTDPDCQFVAQGVLKSGGTVRVSRQKFTLSRMLLDPTPVRLKRCHACNQ